MVRLPPFSSGEANPVNSATALLNASGAGNVTIRNLTIILAKM